MSELAIIEGSIMHARSRPARNAFGYRSFCLRIPLSQMERLEDVGIARNRFAPIAFVDADHGARDGSPLEPWIRALLAQERIDASGEVVLYTLPRMLGYVFNPVSFWVCHDAQGAVRAVLAEVSNTFGERHNYLVAAPDGGVLENGATVEARKVFHVSPFCPVEGRYRFRFHESERRWLARIDYHDGSGDGIPLIATSVSGHAAPLTRRAVRALAWRYRWFTLAVIARIHWQAVRLWCKRVRWFTKPAPPTLQTTR
jgi:uncharacterized protein